MLREDKNMSIKENLKVVKERINQACINSNRNPNEVKLIAVSKFHPESAILQAIHEGQILFGENRVQEAKEKFTSIYKTNPEVELHIIGSLQRNKVKDACKISCCIESVDRLDVLEEIEKQCAKLDKKIDVLFELHTGEESKSGFPDYDSIYKVLELTSLGKFPHVNPKGFMTMAPFTDNKILVRKSFSTLREYSQKLKLEFSQFDLTELSMGMSGDFEIAIEEGSTIVRIGTSIFGERQY